MTILASLTAFTIATMASAGLAMPSVIPPTVTVGPASVAMSARTSQLGETSVAVDPSNSDHIVVLADLYGAPTSIVMVESLNGGRTWSKARPLVPPGSVTSYDSDIRFTPTGEFMIAGGAARPTSPGCNADSLIFIADVDSTGRITYRLVRSVLGLNQFADRPALAVDPLTGEAYVSWTESHGSLAACRGRPARSSTQLSHAEVNEAFSTPVRIPSSGLRAPYGSSLALLRSGSVLVAVGEYGIGGESRLVITESSDQGLTFSMPVVLARRPAATRKWEWRGWALGVPSLAVVGDRVAVSWVDTTGARQSPMVFERIAQHWIDIRPTPSPVADALLVTVRFTADGALWLAVASITDTSITYSVDHRKERWSGPQALASSPASFRELGELVGVDSFGSTTIIAVPIDAPERSYVSTFRVSIQ